jgi:hypothetical protein
MPGIEEFPGRNGDLILVSDSGARSVRTIARTGMLGIISVTIMRGLAPTVGEKTESLGSLTINNGCALRWDFGTGAMQF